VEKRSNTNDKVVSLADYAYDRSWTEVFRTESVQGTSMTVHVNKQTGEFDVVLMNNEGEAIPMQLNTVDSMSLVAATKLAHENIMKKT